VTAGEGYTLRREQKSAEAIDKKRVVREPLRRRVRNPLKRKDLNVESAEAKTAREEQIGIDREVRM
jgi:hypothetical protein